MRPRISPLASLPKRGLLHAVTRWRPLAGLCLAAVTAALLLATPGQGARAEEEMTFQSVNLGTAAHCARRCPTVISAVGQITERTPQMFLEFLQQNGQGDVHAVVFLDSPGGGVIASMEFGTLMRKIGAAAVVARVLSDGAGGTVIANAQCFSACVYALIGARKRVIPVQSQVGIHRMFLSVAGIDAATQDQIRRTHYDNGGVGNYLARYAGRMGVSPDLIAHAEHIPSENLHILSRAEIRKWHLGVPYL